MSKYLEEEEEEEEKNGTEATSFCISLSLSLSVCIEADASREYITIAPGENTRRNGHPRQLLEREGEMERDGKEEPRARSARRKLISLAREEKEREREGEKRARARIGAHSALSPHAPRDAF